MNFHNSGSHQTVNSVEDEFCIQTKDSVLFVLLLLLMVACIPSSDNTDRLVLKLNVRDHITHDNSQ